MRQVGRSVQCRQNRRGRTAATWPFLMSDTERIIPSGPMYVAADIEPLERSSERFSIEQMRARRLFTADLPHRANDRQGDSRVGMRDDETIRVRLEQLRDRFLLWGTPDLQVFVIAKDELRGWIRALEWCWRA